MDKNPITKPPEIDETPRAKSGKHKKRATLCKDKRRGYGNCHICGSEDIIYEVLVWCETCGNETFNIAGTKHLWRWEWDDIELPCTCEETSYPNHKLRKYKRNPRQYTSTEVCMACGSMKADTCPNCHKTCWTSPFGEKRCTACGYRQDTKRRNNEDL